MILWNLVLEIAILGGIFLDIVTRFNIKCQTEMPLKFGMFLQTYLFVFMSEIVIYSIFYKLKCKAEHSFKEVLNLLL